MIKVLVVEDSPTVREFLVNILTGDPGLEVIGTAQNGQEALQFLRHNKPDLITMDIFMPGLNGFETTRRIMETTPTPIVIVSGNADPSEVSTTFRALEAGALAVLARPQGHDHTEHESAVTDFLKTVKWMAEVKVIKRWERQEPPTARVLLKDRVNATTRMLKQDLQIVAIGSSTGGPLALQLLLQGLAPTFPLPIVIVQHISPGFIPGFVQWLGDTTGFPVHVAVHRGELASGNAYIAPDGLHMGITSDRRILLANEASGYELRPSVSYLFRSVAENFGEKAIGILLSGMGKDGAAELKELRMKGAVTAVQDKGSAVVHGMAGEAIRMDAAQYVLPPDKIAALVRALVQERHPVNMASPQSPFF